MKYSNIREEELKNKIAQDYFWIYDCTKIVGNIDFCVSMHQGSRELSEQESLLWAEAKKGSSDIYNSMVQLIITIGKARTFDKFLPPPMLGAFDGEKIAFIPYNEIHEIFYQNDFNWNVTPSDYTTKEFKLVHSKVKSIIDNETLLFYYENDEKELHKFIKSNFVIGKFGITKTKIDKNNFMVIYNKWLQEVKSTIAVNWDVAKNAGIIDGDFYLADLLSRENITLKEKLFVLLKNDHYELDRKINEYGLFSSSSTSFTDNQKAHIKFWNKYDRPPKEDYWDYIVERRDLLVPQDIRERKGSFFTPQIWVELSHKYLADVFGEDWQDEYYIWDCAAGTGNLLAGLTNKYNIWASTLDKQDVDVMHDRIESMNSNSPTGCGANLLKDHVFQFDFLNDDFAKLPKTLQDVINNPDKRKKLIIYINPPYAEGDTVIEKKNIRKGVASTKIYKDYYELLGTARGELFAQFFIRVNINIPNSILASFSTMKYINSENFAQFRNSFKAKFEKGFIVNAKTFDNVIGNFPIGFLIWDLSKNSKIKNIDCEAFNNKNEFICIKTFYNTDGNKKFLNSWLKLKYDKTNCIGKLGFVGNDFQNQKLVFITKNGRGHHETNISTKNLQDLCIYFSVRHCIEHTWLNHNDQFLFPNKKYENDIEFRNNCLVYALFHEKNRISGNGINHWIPFSEQEVNAREKFESDFMSKFIKGKIKPDEDVNLFTVQEPKENYEVALKFSDEALAVFDAGRELWKYYHSKPNCNVNASLYDIKEYFQGRNEKGKMNNKSSDEEYMTLLGELRNKLQQLEAKIEPKVYEYGFLKN